MTNIGGIGAPEIIILCLVCGVLLVAGVGVTVFLLNRKKKSPDSQSDHTT